MRTHMLFLIVCVALVMTSCGSEPKKDTRAENPSFRDELKVEIYDSTALAFIDSNATFEILAEGFSWSEGPLWMDTLDALVFSDVPANTIYKWSAADSLSVYLKGAGHSGEKNMDSGMGPNGLILDREGNLLLCQHGDRRIARLDADLNQPKQKFVTVAEAYQGKRFNSPNDLVMDRSGQIYFTDPPYGRPENKTGEIGMNGVFVVSPDQEVTLLSDSLSWPNGIGLSPDEDILYINQSDPSNPVLYSYEVAGDGSLRNGKVLFDFYELSKSAKGLPDGLKVHKSGNIFATGPGGVHIISPEGKHLAAIQTGKATANCAFDSDQRYLYTTTTDKLLRVALK